jgi:c-di-GMP-related signal transduction protein
VSDIILFRVTKENVRIRANSVHGMLWLQTHFNNDDWDEISQGVADLDLDDATRMSQDANQAGLRVYYPTPKTFPK